MSRLTLDPATSAQLAKVESPLDLYDPNGKVLGRFVPIPADKREPQVSEEELQRRESNGGGRSLTAILGRPGSCASELDRRLASRRRAGTGGIVAKSLWTEQQSHALPTPSMFVFGLIPRTRGNRVPMAAELFSSRHWGRSIAPCPSTN